MILHFFLGHTKRQLRYYQNNIVFDFVTPWLYNADKIQYRYKLEGSDKNWIYLGNSSSVHFSSIQPGRYRFQVAASYNGINWYAMKTPFLFEIMPPFWKTWWFVLLMAISFTAIAVYTVRKRIEFIKKIEADKTELQKVKTASYLDRLKAEQVINYFATSISTQTTVEDMLWDVAANLIGKLGFEDCMIYLWNNDKTILMQKAGFGLKGSMQSKKNKEIYHIPKGKGIVGAAVESRHYIMANDTSKDERYFSADEKIRLSELCVPIVQGNEAVGAINTEHSEKNFYTTQHLHILITIASMLADKIDTIEAQERAREKEMEVLKLNKDLATSQLTALRAQMNPHFLFNAMNSIQQFTLTNDIENANLYISKFSTLLRKVLYLSQQSFITLEEELLQLELYLEIEKLRLGIEFSYFIQKETDLEVDAIYIPGMLIQPFVENALKQGLAPKIGDKILKIEISLPELDILKIIITDNGIGRQKANELKLRQEKLLPYISKGLKLVEERLQLIAGKPAFDLFHFKDNFDDNGQAIGTTVTLTIPVASTNI